MHRKFYFSALSPSTSSGTPSPLMWESAQRKTVLPKPQPPLCFASATNMRVALYSFEYHNIQTVFFNKPGSSYFTSNLMGSSADSDAAGACGVTSIDKQIRFDLKELIIFKNSVTAILCLAVNCILTHFSEFLL